MATLTSQLIVRLIDGVTGPANAAARSLRGLNSAAAAGGVVGQYQRSLARTTGAIVDLRDKTQKSASFGAPVAAGLGYAAKLAFDFEKAGNFMEALGDATAEQRAEFEKYANTLNQKYPQTLGEIIRTGNELLKAGLNFDQMKGAIDQTLATAILGDMKPSEVAAIISAALNSFQLPMETTQEAIKSTQLVTDRMTYASVKTTASLRDMGDMFKYVGAAASATGNSIDDVTALAMAFAKTKIVGSEAGVALRSAIVRIAKGGTKEGRASLSKANMDFRNYQREQKPVTTENIMKMLEAGGIDAEGKHTGGIDASPIRDQIDALVKDPELSKSTLKLAQRVTALVQEHLTKSGSAIDAKVISEMVQESIVASGSGVDLLRFFEDLGKAKAKGLITDGDITQILEGRHFSRYIPLLKKDLRKIKSTIEAEADGYTQSRYEIVIKGIVGAFYELEAALEGLSVAFGRAVFPEVAAGLKRISDAARGLSETNPTILKMIAAFAGFLVVLGPIGLLMTGAVASIGMFVAALSLIGNAAIAASAGLLMVGRSLLFGTALKSLGLGLLALLNPMRLVAGAALLMRGALMLTGIGAILGGIALAGAFIYNNWAGIGEAFQSFGSSFMEALGPAEPAVQGVIDKVSSLASWLGELVGPIDASTWSSWGEAAGKAAGEIAASFMQLWNGDDATFEALGRKLGEKLRSVGEFAKNLGKEIIDALTNINLFDLGSGLMSKLYDGLASWGSKIKSFFSGLFTGISTPPVTLPAVPKAAPAQSVPARAAGGPVSAGQSYLVGERGPELITPSRSGYVHPTGSFGIGGQTAGAGGITVSPVFNMTFNGKTDSEDVVEQIRRVLRDEVRETFRGVFSDTSMRFA